MTRIRGLDAEEQEVLDNIEQYGCQVQVVFDEAARDPMFAYSIGIPATAAQPEVIVYGLSRDLMISMINEVVRQCRDDGLVLEDGGRIGGLLEGFDCIAREVTDPAAIAEHFGWAIWYHRSQHNAEMTRAYQLVWPGAQQRLYPWQDGCDSIVKALQPALYERGTIQ